MSKYNAEIDNVFIRESTYNEILKLDFDNIIAIKDECRVILLYETKIVFEYIFEIGIFYDVLTFALIRFFDDLYIFHVEIFFDKHNELSLSDFQKEFPRFRKSDIDIQKAVKKEVGRKDDSGKPRLSLLPPKALRGAAYVMDFGAGKYGEGNYKHVKEWRKRYLDAALRHILAEIENPNSLDDESGLPHHNHALTCLMFVSELAAEEVEMKKEAEETIV